MRKILSVACFLLFYPLIAQTTDLAISVEARNLANVAVSQVGIYEEFYYLVTITNSGNAVSNATFSQTFSSTVEVVSYQSQNELGGAAPATSFNLTGTTLTATLPSMPASSSLQIKVILHAPVNTGGISTTSTVLPPPGTTDTNPSSNQSIISTSIVLSVLDFTITHTQTNPSSGGISAWGGLVTYQFTITNNSSVDFPITGFSTRLFLNTPVSNGTTHAQLMSLNCIGANGMACPTLDPVSGNIEDINTNSSVDPIVTFNQNTDLVFPQGASISFQMVYKYDGPGCAEGTPTPIQVTSFIEVYTENVTYDVFESNQVVTPLLSAESCICTDIAVENTVVSGAPGNVIADWNDIITFQTTVSNLGPEDADVTAIFQNLLNFNITWQILSVGCVSNTGITDCSTITYILGGTGQNWETSSFFLEAGATIVFETQVQFIPPGCVPTSTPSTLVKATKSQDMPDCENLNDIVYLTLYTPPIPPCDNTDIFVTQTQTDPVLPIGSAIDNTMPWDPVTYQVTVTNPGTTDTYFTLIEYVNYAFSGTPVNFSGTLLSVNCIGTTGTAVCQTVANALIGQELSNVYDIFFSITEEDQWLLPGNSSITLEFVIQWSFPCSDTPTKVATSAYVDTVDPISDFDSGNNTKNTFTWFATCVDLVVQTYPSSPTVSIDTYFNWIVDISNSPNSSNAIDAVFESVINDAFTLNGTPVCTVTSGNAQCISGFTINGNTVTGIIPYMEPGSTIKVIIPVISPFYNGSFNNVAQAQPDLFNNGELSPETNVSVSSVQILAPSLTKEFSPDEILAGQITTLSFTIYNIIGNPAQSNISFTDNLPPGITLMEAPQWVTANNVTADFIGETGDNFVGVESLHFPQGVESCTFSVMVTAAEAGFMINDFANFNNLSNVQAFDTYATLNVIENPNPNLDLKLTKTVDIENPKIGDEVVFTITLENLSNLFATNIEVQEVLPAGYTMVTYSASMGTYDGMVWSIPLFLSGEIATLQITATVNAVEDYVNTATIVFLDQTDTNAANNTDSAAVNPDCFSIYNGISPNGDGRNDAFTIDCIAFYQNNLKIYNRLGTLIFEQDNYDNSWEGIPNRGMLKETNGVVPVGTYYYVLTLPEKDRVLTGWLYVNY